jgi:soluble lytic murein transglycosylase-like protein
MISGAGLGLGGVESRIRQIEGLMQSVQKSPSPAPFAATMQAPAAPGLPSGGISYLDAPPRLAKPGPQAFQTLVGELSARHGVDPDLVHAVIQQESGYNPRAVSGAGAQGLMQLMPGTAQQLGVTNAMDPVQNVDGGVRYLKSQLERFNGNIPLALAAYNAGPGAVQKHGGVPPYKETQGYVRRILANYLAKKAPAIPS